MSFIRSIPKEFTLPVIGERSSTGVFAAVGILGALTVTICWKKDIVPFEKFRSWLGLSSPQQRMDLISSVLKLDEIEEPNGYQEVYNAALLIWITLSIKFGEGIPREGSAYTKATISGDLVRWCQARQEELSGIIELELKDRGLNVLPLALAKLTNLKHLDLSCNPIEGFPEVLTLLNLESLTLDQDQAKRWIDQLERTDIELHVLEHEGADLAFTEA